jgi:regulator of RNase E activity RraA
LDDMTVLEDFDTPTICNALELIDNSRRDCGYTRFNMTVINAAAGPVVGFALTATMRSEKPSELSANELKQARLDYYEYMFTDMGGPKICVMHDADDPDAVHGPFWGEFNTRIHRAMGFRGVVTDGCVRDLRKLPADVLLLARGLRPSHANMHIVSYGEPVKVYGMDASHGDVVHADEHGAVAFPAKLVDEIAIKAKEFIDHEAPIMAACNKGGLTLPELRSLYLARKKLIARRSLPENWQSYASAAQCPP